MIYSIKLIRLIKVLRLLFYMVWGYKLYVLFFWRYYLVFIFLDDFKLVVFEKVEKEVESG